MGTLDWSIIVGHMEERKARISFSHHIKRFYVQWIWSNDLSTQQEIGEVNHQRHAKAPQKRTSWDVIWWFIWATGWLDWYTIKGTRWVNSWGYFMEAQTLFRQLFLYISNHYDQDGVLIYWHFRQEYHHVPNILCNTWHLYWTDCNTYHYGRGSHDYACFCVS